MTKPLQNQSFSPASTALQAQYIKSIFEVASSRGVPLWLESGWAIDARIGQITREHDDIDIAYPEEHHEAFVNLLADLGFAEFEQLDYGFLMSQNGVLIDSEPCAKVGTAYELPGFPAGSCPDRPEGRMDWGPIRCISWQAMYFEFLTYEQEVPRAAWRPKDHDSLRLIEQHLLRHEQQQVKRHFEMTRT